MFWFYFIGVLTFMVEASSGLATKVNCSETFIVKEGVLCVLMYAGHQAHHFVC